ncbi:DUF350 domain-containing protein [Thalassomonas actiniarum]|uniref:DUF350 domain-containing protein n=1 Tax=Thalassomonas actiniarum TaxID=485447 RepID=A0AAF0C3R2_9GAMM|nr:DUF350 domain-containing protein [Thalassomonas actiniarum]WDD99205.1 DUF350 domain-containing protein [Thalassomonas actiniarum]
MGISILTYLSNLAFIGVFLIVIFASRWLYSLSSPYNTFSEIIDKKNLALGISIMGFITANTIIYSAVITGLSQQLQPNLMAVCQHTALGMLLLLVSRQVNDKVLLHSCCSHRQIITKQSLSVGMAQASCYITSGLIIGGVLMRGGDIFSVLVFYALGQVSLVLFTKIYDLFTNFCLIQELESGNIAAGTSFSATVIALGIILLHALGGEFVSWQSGISSFALDALTAFIILPVVRMLVDKLLIPSVNIDYAIKKEHNVAVALLEGAVAISVALVIFFAL